ncbi:MAG: ATP-binding cassette domain-containing protein [Bacteroidota bacterium]
MIALNNINKVFNAGKLNEVAALKDINITIEAKEFVVIIGANGSGKSTLMNIISGAEKPTSGTILINDKDVTDIPEYKRSEWISRVFQNPLSGTAPNLSIIENFRLAALRTHSKMLSVGISEQFKKTVQDKISMLDMGLEHKINQPMGTLSGGQRQALTLLMSVMDTTEVLLLDEPTAALDPKTAHTILQAAEKIIQQLNLTAIFITHNLKDAHQYGNRLLRLQDGRIVNDLNAATKSSYTPADLLEWFI